MSKLAAFDFDSTLVDAETIDLLATAYGVGDKVKCITESCMQGKLDFFESLKRRVSALKGMPLKQAQAVCDALPCMNGAVELLRELKGRGYKIVVLSGGFDIATRAVQERLGIDAYFTNILCVHNGFLNGEVGGEMMFATSKGSILARLQKLMDISPDDTLACGDGANDVSMFALAKTKVAFCAKDILKKEANVIIDRRDLREILNYI